MTHEEYVSNLDRFSDEDAAAVLAHAESCRVCRREARRIDTDLLRLEAGRGALAEEIARWAAVAALLAVIVIGLRQPSSPPPKPAAPPARYRVVGNASGVVAYTPGGMVVGLGTKPAPKEVVR